ncbi:MAG: ligase-associated DNA damage response DEXH box helicase [Rhodospirillaceae bacterium]|nr:ligase-associated DNA damage response DEXH box helicase [Rhodospirillaceae bacterium]
MCWFAARGWRPFPHQLAMVDVDRAGRSALLIAPTGAGKTLAGFLPSLIALAGNAPDKAADEPGGNSAKHSGGLHTLYISPLKALAVDIHRNLEIPIEEMALGIECETRTGDTPAHKRQRQRRKPPQILMTTPESLALLLSYADAPMIFGKLERVVVDELHALANTKRGDLLALGLARLQSLSLDLRRVGLSATVADERHLLAFLSPTGRADNAPVDIVRGAAGPAADVTILATSQYLPWSGHMATHALPEVYQAVKRAGTTIVFVNTRAQAEIVFQALWRLNDDNLPIALHHGSLAPEQRRKVEAAMARGILRAVVATSSLDLGIDWGAVDLVIQIGAPKGASRLVQRIGRANHRHDEPSRALLVPANRFEVLECRAALEAVKAGELDGDPPKPGGLDVLAQHITGMACEAPFTADGLYAEVTRAAPYAELSRATFDAVLDFVATGGYALRRYEQWHRLAQDEDGRWKIARPGFARRYRMNVGTIVQQPMIRVKLKRGRVLGEIEEYFVQGLVPGDSFVFAGELLRYVGMRELHAEVTRGGSNEDPKVPAYEGGKLPLTAMLAQRVRGLLAEPGRWRTLPPAVQEWLEIQRLRSELPEPDGLLVETFPRGRKEFLVAYCFEGRNAHQTLGMLLTRRMERAGLHPLGFVATDYIIAVWSLKPVRDVAALFAPDMLGDDLEAWMDESSMLRRSFRNVAVIAGLIERRHPGEQKTGKQVTFSSDLIYDVLRRHDPQHILLQATRADAAGGLTDIKRLGDMLTRVEGKIRHRRLRRLSPLAVPALLEIGKESVYGAGLDELMDEAATELIAEAMAEFTDDDPVPELPL